MSRIRNALAPLLSICLLFMFFGVTALFPQGVRAADPVGSIVFYDGDDDKPTPGPALCTLSFNDGTHSFPDTDNCQNDEARWFSVTNAPSATLIRLDDHPTCEDDHDQNFIFILKIVKNNATMEQPVSFDVLKGVKAGQIVPGAPGVRMERNYLDKDNEQVNGKLSCVKITRSAIPD